VWRAHAPVRERSARSHRGSGPIHCSRAGNGGASPIGASVSTPLPRTPSSPTPAQSSPDASPQS
jgi:hypothetical protein